MYLYLLTFYLYFIIFCCTYNYIKKVHSWWLMLHLFSKPSWWSTLYDTIKYNSSQFCLRPLNCYRNCICKPKYLRQVCNENLLSQFKMLIKNNEGSKKYLTMFKTQNMLIKKTLSNWQFLLIIFTALIYCNLLIWSRNIDSMNIGIWNFCCTTSIVQYKRMIHQVWNAHSIAIFLNKNEILWVSFHSWVIFF